MSLTKDEARLALAWFEEEWIEFQQEDRNLADRLRKFITEANE